MNKRACTIDVIEAPFGPVVALGLAGKLVYTDMGPDARARAAAFAGRHDLIPEPRELADMRARLGRYLAGNLDAFEDMPVRFLGGTPFQQQVWLALRRLPGRRLETYGRVAADIGRAAAVRAVGQAIGRNPLSLVIPCHRVVGSDGKLTGFGCGLPVKRALLRHEGWTIDASDRVVAQNALPLAGHQKSAMFSATTI